MGAGPAYRVKYILILLARIIKKFRWQIIAFSFILLSFLPIFKNTNYILTHSLLTESAIDKISNQDIAFSSKMQSVLDYSLASAGSDMDDLLTDNGKAFNNDKVKKSVLPDNFSEFIPYQTIDSNDSNGKVNAAYIHIAKAIKQGIKDAEIYLHKFTFENTYQYSLFIILKCKRCVPFYSNLTVSTMDKNTTLAPSLLLGVISSLANKPFLSQNHYYLLVPKQIKYAKALSTFLHSYNYDLDLPFQKYQIHLSHVIDFDNNCSNTLYLHYEGLNGYKPPLDWSVAVLNEFIRHGINIQTLPLWESLRRQVFNTHFHEQHSKLMEYGIPSFTIAGKCNSKISPTRATLLRALHVLARDQGNMDESMEECINFYTFVSNKHFLPLSAYFIPLTGLIAVLLHHTLAYPGIRNPQILLYGMAFYLLNILIISLFPFTIMGSNTMWRIYRPLLFFNKKRAHIAMACFVILCFVALYINSILNNLKWGFEVFDKKDMLEDNLDKSLEKIWDFIVTRMKNKFVNTFAGKKIVEIFKKLHSIYSKLLEKIPKVHMLTVETLTNRATTSIQNIPASPSLKNLNLAFKDNSEFHYFYNGKVIGYKTALDIAARLFCLFWIIGTLLFNVAQALWLILVLFIPLTSPIATSGSKTDSCTSIKSRIFSWNFFLLAYYIHITLLYIPLPQFLSTFRMVYINARNIFFRFICSLLSLFFIPKQLLDFLNFYSYGGFYSKTMAYGPLSRLVLLSDNLESSASYEISVNLFLLYPFWFIVFWVNLSEYLTKFNIFNNAFKSDKQKG